ncbi:MAG: hypothetical protein WBU20_15670, partial [Candidatus Acidiferrum sp.]
RAVGSEKSIVELTQLREGSGGWRGVRVYGRAMLVTGRGLAKVMRVGRGTLAQGMASRQNAGIRHLFRNVTTQWRQVKELGCEHGGRAKGEEEEGSLALLGMTALLFLGEDEELWRG